MIIIGPPSKRHQILGSLGELATLVKPSAKNLGVIFDQDLSFEPQVKKIVQPCFYHLRNIAKVRSFIATTDFEKLIHGFISSRLDYCNSLYTCLSQKSLHHLQLVQNAAARLLTRSKKCDHITPVLAALHWLPVHFRIDFKILLFVFKARHGLAPVYISDILSSYEPARSLRSTGKALLAVPGSRLKTKGDRAFAIRAPRLWNGLPEEIRFAESVPRFISLLKTHFYKKAFML